MDNPHFTASDGEMPYDEHAQPREEHESDPVSTCFDCREEVFSHGVVLSAGIVGDTRVYCKPCWQWRERRGFEFDPRAKVLLWQETRTA
jgi:hypothetical protein